MTNNDTLAFDNEGDDTVIVNRNHVKTPRGLIGGQKPSPPIG